MSELEAGDAGKKADEESRRGTKLRSAAKFLSCKWFTAVAIEPP